MVQLFYSEFCDHQNLYKNKIIKKKITYLRVKKYKQSLTRCWHLQCIILPVKKID